MQLTMSILKSRERVLMWVALVVVALLAWGILVLHGMQGHMPMAGNTLESAAGATDPAPGLLVLATLMWTVMMVAMMLPSAAPMILTYLRVNQKRGPGTGAGFDTCVFVAGYLMVWLAFAVTAALAQWALHQSALLSSPMGHVDPRLGGALLIVAGVFQFSGLKHACLSKCRSPLSLLMTQWREGTTGALVMGARHGGYCTGCCWALMLLMFVGGVMNLAWMAGLALYFLAEKIVPRAEQVRWISGGLLAGAGVIVLLGAGQ